MSKHTLIAAFEQAALERDMAEDDCTIEEYDEARSALEEAIVEHNPAAAVIKYILNADGENNIDDSSDAMDFLRYWYEGEFDILRRNWENIPDEVFIGADPQFVPKEGTKNEL